MDFGYLLRKNHADKVMLLRERHGEKGFMKLVQASMIEFMMAAFNWIRIVRSEGPEAIDARVKSMLEARSMQTRE